MKHKGKLLRKCNGCNQMKNKNNLIRICKTADSREVVIDFTYKIDGRGAYVCKDSLECLGKAIKFNKIARTLKTDVPLKLLETLQVYIKNN